MFYKSLKLVTKINYSYNCLLSLFWYSLFSNLLIIDSVSEIWKKIFKMKTRKLKINLAFNFSMRYFLSYVQIIEKYIFFPVKHTLGEVWVQKTSEMNTDKQYFCRTHLGHLLNPGDLVLGFVLFYNILNCQLALEIFFGSQ